MKLTPELNRYCKSRKYLKDEKKVTFKPELPLELGNAVSGNLQKFRSNACIQEMFVMMACLKDNDFEQLKCFEQIKKFNNCNDTYFANREQKRANEKAGILTPGAKYLSASQVNTLLKRFPVK